MKKILLFTLFLVSILSGKAQEVVQSFLDINDINAGFLNQGDMFWNPSTEKASFEYPKGSNKHCNFGNVLWVGRQNKKNGNIHFAAQGWRTKNEYWPGPLNDDGFIQHVVSNNWNQIWRVNQTTIDSFLSIKEHTLNNTHRSILEWPAKGNIYTRTPQGDNLEIPDRNMAPFEDVDGDGMYKPVTRRLP